VAILLGALSGEPKRQIDVLDQGDRERAARIFIVLDALYVEKVPLSVRGAQFFGCVQKSDEPVQAYLLWLRELLLNWKEKIAPTYSNLITDVMRHLELEKIRFLLKNQESSIEFGSCLFIILTTTHSLMASFRGALNPQ